MLHSVFYVFTHSQVSRGKEKPAKIQARTLERARALLLLKNYFYNLQLMILQSRAGERSLASVCVARLMTKFLSG